MTDRIAQLQKLLTVDPDDTFCLYALAQEYAKASDHAQAIEYYDRVLAVDSDYCYAYYHKARAQEDAGDVHSAATTLREGLERATASGDAKAASEIQDYLEMLQ